MFSKIWNASSVFVGFVLVLRLSGLWALGLHCRRAWCFGVSGHSGFDVLRFECLYFKVL